jgi:chromosome segregation ATPase
MSESEQAINVSEWKELHAELEEVSDKRNRLQAENNRLKALIQLRQKECDHVKNELRQMTAERDHAKAQWEVCCEDRSRQVTALREQLAEVTAERDAARKFADDSQVVLGKWKTEHDAVKEQLAQAKEAADMFEQENISLRDTVQQLRAKQIHEDLPGILCTIRLAVEQARELI